MRTLNFSIKYFSELSALHNIIMITNPRHLYSVKYRTQFDMCQRRFKFAAVGRRKSTSRAASKKAPDIGGLLSFIVLFLGGFCGRRLGLA